MMTGLNVRRMRTPATVSVMCAAFANILTVVAIATDYWETVEYMNLGGVLLRNDSYADDVIGFYKIVLTVANETNATTPYMYYVTARHGGIWRVCDRIPESFRSTALFQESRGKGRINSRCYYYVPDYDKTKLSDKGIALVRMQNSAISCVIVTLLCLIAAACTGFFGVWKKQVSACMVTGVMYSVSGVFLCFTLTIMMTKIRCMYKDCYALDFDARREICDLMDVRTSWSMAVGWAAFGFTAMTVISWLYLSRFSRLELSKSVI